MATKTINGSYPAGYALNPAYQTLNIGTAANILGAGVTTSAAQTSAINNLGSVAGSGNGITLSAGGAITNGSIGNATALIEGTKPIVVDAQPAAITNFGRIRSDQVASGYNGYDSYIGPSIIMTAGGSVTNGAGSDITASISNGIDIAGGLGTVVNKGTVGGTFRYRNNYAWGLVYRAYSIYLEQGGTIQNGSTANSTATIENGVILGQSNKLGDCSVTNFGTIFSSYFPSYHGGLETFGTGAAVRLRGTIDTLRNGDSTHTSALISGYTDGVVMGGAFSGGTLSNFGTIEAHASFPGYFTSYGVRVTTSGQTITNGSAAVTTALISGDTVGLFLAGSTATNFGRIENTESYYNGGRQPTGVFLRFGATITNGSAASHAATIYGTSGVSGSGTIVNFGTIEGAGGAAVVFSNSTSNKLVQQGSGVLIGTVALGGGTLELGGAAGPGALNGLGSTITGFKTAMVDRGARWSLTGASSLAKSTVLSNSGALTLAGQVVNSGQITNLAGGKLVFGGDYSITTDPAVKAGKLSNAGLIEKKIGAGTSIIRTGTATLTSTGIIDVETGTLELTGSTITITGAIKGAGTIEFGVGATTLGDGSSISTANFDIVGSGAHVTVGRSLAYANDFSATAGTELTITAGDLLKLTGTASFAHDTVDGAGRLATTGTATINDVTLGGTAQWYNTGTINETGGMLTVGDNAGHQAIFVNQQTGVFNLAGNVGLGIGSAATSTFTNQGLLAKTAGGLSTVSIAIVNTGTIEAASGTLDLQKAVTSTGMLKIDAGKILQADAAVSAGQTVDFNGGGDRLVLTDAAHFAARLQDFGAGDKLDLRQFNPATTTLGFAENAAHTAGTLTVTDGPLVARIALLGQYSASAFHTASDGLGGTNVTYVPQAASALATPHS